jgi:hypothetical protein
MKREVLGVAESGIESTSGPITEFWRLNGVFVEVKEEEMESKSNEERATTR